MTSRCRFTALKIFGLFVLLTACQAQSSTPTRDAESAGPVTATTPADLHRQALTRDPQAVDDGLRGALTDFRDKFKCNNISGCKPEEVLLGFGWQALPQLQMMFAQAPSQAPYRSRIIKVIAEMRAPMTLGTLAKGLQDRDADVRGYAAYGLALLEAQAFRPILMRTGQDPVPVWQAPARVGALWGAGRLGDSASALGFVAYLKALAQENMAGPALAWGVELCMRPESPDCREVLPTIARHASFTARRQAARAMAARPLIAYAPALIELTADPVHSIARVAQAALVQLAGVDLPDAAAWRVWCAQQHCQDKGLGAVKE